MVKIIKYLLNPQKKFIKKKQWIKKYDNDIKINWKLFIYLKKSIFDKNIDEIMKRKKIKNLVFKYINHWTN